MNSWYERNREKAIENAKTWRLNNLERFRELNRGSKRRRRAEKRRLTYQMSPNFLPLAPEGWEGEEVSGTIEDFCRRRGIPNDPRQW